MVYTLANAQKPIKIEGKTFENVDENNSKEQYTFLSNNKAKLVMKTEVNGKYFEDICSCQYNVEGSKIKIICNCEDKEVYPNPLKETFIYNSNLGTLTTTIHYDRNRKPRIFQSL
jgi:hypothetical protein